MTNSQIKQISITEFREFGFLQEINRKFLHPLGLALEVIVDEDGERLGRIWDYRDDPEGMAYAQDLDPEKTARVDALRESKAQARQESLGYLIQPTAPTEQTE